MQDLVGDTMTMMVFSVDLCRHSSWDLSSSVVFDVIMTAIQEGLIDAVMSGPPCATWSRARWHASVKGARPMRTRSAWQWGVPWLNEGEKARLKKANDCMVLALSSSEGIASRGGTYLLEHPEDPGEEPFASI